MIHFRNFTLARGARKLIEDANLQIHAGWRVGLVGANGSGKSSLFALLRGELHSELGDCEVPVAWRIATVAQETPALDQFAIDYVLDGDTELRQIEREIAAAEAHHEGGDLLGELHGRLNDIGGYGAHSRAAALLAGLGFASEDIERSVSEFSGGWRMRLNLAQALVSRCDLMLLDEPTNHLDLDAVVWLEKWLATFRGTLVVVSHDRDFLDGCTTNIAHIYNERLTLYTGNYTAFETQRAAQLAVQQSMFEKQQRQIEHLEKYIARFRAQATKARQAQSRLKALDRMEVISAAHVDTPFDFAFMAPERAPDPMLTLDEVDAGYDGVPVIKGVKLTLRPGARIGLLGPNGAGKSTLVKLLSGEQTPLAGRRVDGRGLAIGYFAQHQLEQLRPDESPLKHMTRSEPRTREQELRNYLGGFDFRGNMVDTPVGPFSGGEKSRLALALMIRTRPNLLLLDEPTNHLDLEMRQALTMALAEYEGSLVLVSHDRTLLRTVCDSFLLVADGKVQEFDGDVEDYLQWLTARRLAQNAKPGAAAKAVKVEKPALRENRVNPQQQQGSRRPLEKESAKLDRDLAKWNTEKRDLDARLADPALYQNASTADLRVMAARQTELAKLIDTAEHRWLEVQADLEAMGAVQKSA